MLKPLKGAIDGWTPHEGAAPPASDPLAILGSGWEEVVGAEVARNSHPSQITGDTLLVITRSSAWSHQLSFLAPTALVAIRERLPEAGIQRLSFRVGRLDRRGIKTVSATPVPRSERVASQPAQSADEAIERFRADVDANQRAKRVAGWKECHGCGVQIPPGRADVCAACRSDAQQARAKAVARMLYETPGIDFADVASHVEGLTRVAFESEKRRLLSRWRIELDRAARDRRLSRNGRERLIASSYVLLKTGIAPERIAPATIRNELGDAVYELIYGTER